MVMEAGEVTPLQGAVVATVPRVHQEIVSAGLLSAQPTYQLSTLGEVAVGGGRGDGQRSTMTLRATFFSETRHSMDRNCCKKQAKGTTGARNGWDTKDLDVLAEGSQ